MDWIELHRGLLLIKAEEPPPAEEWLELYGQDLSLAGVVPPTEEWLELYSQLLLLRAEGVPPVPPPPPPPEEEAKFPWVPVALLGGGAVIVAASMKPKIK